MQGRTYDPAELDVELLAEAIGRRLTRNPDHPVWRDDRFLAWLATEARARAEHGVRVSERVAAYHGEQFMARVQGKRLGVSRSGEPSFLDIRPGRIDRAFLPAGGGAAAVPLIEQGIAAGVGRDLWEMETSTWVELPPGLPKAKYLALGVVGESMAPVMHTGDTILVRIEKEIRRNTAIVARHPEDGYVCKRVHRLRRETIELSSLEPGRPLIVIPRDPQLIVGTVVLVWCKHRGGDVEPPDEAA